MRYLALVAFTCLSTIAISQDDHGHDHGPAAAAGGPTIINTELNLKITDPQGKPVTGINDSVRFELRHEGNLEAELTSHAEEDPGTYHVDQVFEEEGNYTLTWKFPVAGNDQTTEFNVLVGHAEEEHEHGPNYLLIGLGVAGLAAVAFAIGRSTGRSRPAVVGSVLALSLFASTPNVLAGGEEDGHDHGTVGAPASAEPLQIGIEKLGSMIQTKEVNGYRVTLTVIVLPPDPNIVRMDAEQRELLDLQVETVSQAAFGKGLTATGEVVVDPSRTANLSVSVSGKVTMIDVKEGSVVRQGQTLAIVDSPEAAGAQAELAAAQAVVYQAQANRQRATKAVELARQNLRRQQEFAQTGAFSQPSLLAARREVQEAIREVKEAESRLAQATIKHETHDRDLHRIEELFKAGLASRKQLEEAQLEDKLDSEALAQAENLLVDAKARKAAAEMTLSREEDIARRGLLNRQEIETARAEVSRAEGELKAADTEIRGAQSTIQAARIRIKSYGGSGGRIPVVSPISGTVTKRLVSSGQAVSPGQVLLEVLNTNEIWVHADIFETDLTRVRVGMPVEVAPDSDPKRLLRGLVATIGQVVDAEKRTASVRIKIANPDGALRQNEFASVLIIADVLGRNLSVPESALQEVGGVSVVFVESGDAFRRTPVKLGTKSGGRVEILEGLKPGDRVVTQGSYQLRMMAVAQ